MSDSNSSEGGFDKLLQKFFNDKSGETIVEILANPVFLGRLKSYCDQKDYRPFHGTYSPEDQKQDILLKMYVISHKLLRQDNTPNAQVFFGWLKVVVRNHHIDKIREYDKAQNHGWVRCPESIEVLDIEAPRIDFVRKIMRSRFLAFSKVYSKERQRAVELWLDNYTCRDIEEVLKREGFNYSYVTVAKWVSASVLAFKASLERRARGRWRKRS